MNEWTFGWDAVAALAGVAAVVVASVLGWQGVRMAAKSVERTSLDYVAARADRFSDVLDAVARANNRVDSALVPLWAWVRDPAGDRPGTQEATSALTALSALEIPLEAALISLDALSGDDAQTFRTAGMDYFSRILLSTQTLHALAVGSLEAESQDQLVGFVRSRGEAFGMPAPTVAAVCESMASAFDGAPDAPARACGRTVRQCNLDFMNWGLDTVRDVYETAAGDLARRRA